MHSYLLCHFDQETAIEKILGLSKLELTSESFLHHPDIFHLQPDSNEKSKVKSIKIEQIRKLQTDLTTAPLHLPFQLGVIWNAECITLAAQQALLKVLEEPKANTQLFLVTPQSHHLFLPTIQSRCQIINQKARDIKSSDGNETLEEELTKLSNVTAAARMGLIEKHSTNREEAVSWLTNCLYVLRNMIPQDEGNKRKALVRLLQNIHTILDDINANSNCKLALDQLALYWDQKQLG